MSVFEQIAAERRTAADLIESLTEEQLATPSLCGAWTVKDVAAHLLMGPLTPLPTFFLAMVRSGGNFHAASRRVTAGIARRPAAEIAQALRDRADHRFTPPGLGPEAPLTDLLVHGQDIRRPLGLTREFEPSRLRIVLDFLASPAARRGFVPNGRLDGLRLEADDVDWSCGEGAPVRGHGEALMLAMTGRAPALADLTGDGVAVLSGRL